MKQLTIKEMFQKVQENQGGISEKEYRICIPGYPGNEITQKDFNCKTSTILNLYSFKSQKDFLRK